MPGMPPTHPCLPPTQVMQAADTHAFELERGGGMSLRSARGSAGAAPKRRLSGAGAAVRAMLSPSKSRPAIEKGGGGESGGEAVAARVLEARLEGCVAEGVGIGLDVRRHASRARTLGIRPAPPPERRASIPPPGLEPESLG